MESDRVVFFDGGARHVDLGRQPLRETAGRVLPSIQLVRSLTGSAASARSGYRSHEKGGQW